MKVPYLDKPDPWSSHSIVATWIQKLPQDSIILDVGTATGTIRRLCSRDIYHWRGLEPVAEWGKIARPLYDDFFIGSIEEAPDEFISSCDFIILADVLEHLPQPEKTLLRIIRHQKTGTRFAISVPNVANLYIRLNLLFGRFEYMERGILDKSHLRFFTRSSIIKSVRESGLAIKAVKTTPIPLSLVHSFFVEKRFGKFVHKTLAILTSLVPTILGYQFVILAELEVDKA